MTLKIFQGTAIIFILLDIFLPTNAKTESFWQVGITWSPCSRTCDEGFETRSSVCLTQTNQQTTKLAPEECANLKRPVLNRRCNLGPCPDPNSDSGTYVWSLSQWSQCSQTCGGGGVRTREVSCHYVTQSGSAVKSSEARCVHKEPRGWEVCNRLDCPPEFIPGEWGKCSEPRGCTPGKRRRPIFCISKLHNGTRTQHRLNACYRARRSPPTIWQQCTQDPRLFNSCSATVKLRPIIETSSALVYQMQRNRGLHLQVGQEAYIMPSNRVMVSCPVKNYPIHEIQWKHNDNIYKFKGQTRGRLGVDKKGKLRIKQFLPLDQGQWLCLAGPASATINLNLRMPSEGISDMTSRTFRFNQDMPQDDSKKNSQTGTVSVQWVVGTWSPCSVTCNANGTQTRYVRCERLESRWYHVLPDSECQKQPLPIPERQRRCSGLAECPVWKIEANNTLPCTGKCVAVGKALRNVNVTCHLGKSRLPDESCDSNSRPQLQCDNPGCDVQWQTSEWSRCSKSCGGRGYSARFVSCVWRDSGEDPAGSLCYQLGLPMPDIVRSCDAPPCRLDCRDLSPYCGKWEFCGRTQYRYMCCKTCYKAKTTTATSLARTTTTTTKTTTLPPT